MKVIGVIPARFKSSRLPGKPLVVISGKTLLQRTFESAKKCKDLDDVYVATDDEKIADHVRSFGGIAILTSEACKNGTTRIYEAFNKDKKLHVADIVVNIQGDHPCIEAQTISQVIEVLKCDEIATIATAVTLIKYEDAISPNIVKCVFDCNYNALYFSRSLIPFRKTLNESNNFYYHVGLYAYKRSFLLNYDQLKGGVLQETEDLEQLQFLENGHRIKVAIVEDNPLGVDIFDDIEKVEKFLCKQNLSSSPVA